MEQPATQHRFPTLRIIAALTAAAAVLWGAGWFVLPVMFDEPAGQVRDALLASAVLVWTLTVLGTMIIAIIGRRGLMPFVTAYFISMGVRMVGAFGGAQLMAQVGWIERGKPLAAALAMVYLPLLLIEIVFIARYMKHGFRTQPAAGPAASGEVSA